jgi:multiple sugar transport system substrate-binding protein
LIEYLTAPAQLRERVQAAGQLPARMSLYDDPAVAQALPVPADDIRRIIDRAIPRPVTPVYTELSGELQVHLHRALTDQEPPGDALALAADRMRLVLRRAGLDGGPR